MRDRDVVFAMVIRVKMTAHDEVVAWVKKFTKNPVYALEWTESMDLFRHVAQLEVATRLEALLNGLDDEEWFEELKAVASDELVRRAESVETSSSTTQNGVRRAVVSVWAGWVRWLETWKEDES